MRLNYIHQEIKANQIQVKYIDTTNNVADIMTKALPIQLFEPLKEKLLTGFENKDIAPAAKKLRLSKATEQQKMLTKIFKAKRRATAVAEKGRK